MFDNDFSQLTKWSYDLTWTYMDNEYIKTYGQDMSMESDYYSHEEYVAYIG